MLLNLSCFWRPKIGVFRELVNPEKGKTHSSEISILRDKSKSDDMSPIPVWKRQLVQNSHVVLLMCYCFAVHNNVKQGLLDVRYRGVRNLLISNCPPQWLRRCWPTNIWIACIVFSKPVVILRPILLSTYPRLLKLLTHLRTAVHAGGAFCYQGKLSSEKMVCTVFERTRLHIELFRTLKAWISIFLFWCTRKRCAHHCRNSKNVKELENLSVYVTTSIQAHYV